MVRIPKPPIAVSYGMQRENPRQQDENVSNVVVCVGGLSFRACNANAIDLHKIFPAAWLTCLQRSDDRQEREERNNSSLSDGRDFGGGCYGAFPVLLWVGSMGCFRLLFLASSPLFAARLRPSHQPYGHLTPCHPDRATYK